MFGFGQDKNKTKTYLVVSVESSVVRVCFVGATHASKPTLTAAYSVPFDGDNPSFTLCEISLKKAVHTAIEYLMVHHSVSVDKTFCVLNAPWYFSRTHTYTRDEESLFSFSRRDIHKVLHNEKQDFHTFLANTPPSSLGDLENIEASILSIAVNGYEVENIPSQKMRRIDVSTYVSFVFSSLKDSISEEIKRHTHSPCTFFTATVAQFAVVRDVFSFEQNHLLVSIDKHQTDISLVEDGVMRGRATIPLGDSLVSETAFELGLDVDTINTKLTMAVKQSLDPKSSQDLHKVLQGVIEEWQKAFFNISKSLAEHSHIPNKVIVFCSPQTFYWISKAVSDPRNKHLSISNSNLHAILFERDNLVPLIGSKISLPDIKLMTYASFAILQDLRR